VCLYELSFSFGRLLDVKNIFFRKNKKKERRCVGGLPDFGTCVYNRKRHMMAHLDKEAFLEIVRRYREGHAGPEEVKFLDSYYAAFETEPDVLDSLNENDQNSIKAEIKEVLSLQLASRQRISDRSQRRRAFFKWGMAAAAVFLVGSLFFLKPLARNEEPAVSVITPEPNGVNNLVQLPDGSTVILGVDSKIDYPSSFEGEKRRVVYLTGQGYFDIKHNPSKPFVVHTGKLQIKVLGTAFNIRAVAGESSISVTVTRGSVQVSNGTKTFSVLRAKEQLIYDIARDEAMQEAVNTDKVMAWTERDLYFDDVTVLTAAELLQDRFGVTIAIRDEHLASQRFTTTFGKDENLESILSSITAFTGAVYEINSDKKQIQLFLK
jgi:transmembrane sensor